MPRYVSVHTLACMTRQGAEALLKKLAASGGAITLRRTVWNFIDGRMLAEFEGAGRESVERWLEENNLRPEWVMRIEYESVGDELEAV